LALVAVGHDWLVLGTVGDCVVVAPGVVEIDDGLVEVLVVEVTEDTC